MERLSRKELNDEADKFIKKAEKAAPQYKTNKMKMPQLESRQKALDTENSNYDFVMSAIDELNAAYAKGGNRGDYLRELARVQQMADEYGLDYDKSYGKWNENNISAIRGGLGIKQADIDKELTDITDTINSYIKTGAEFEQTTAQAAADLGRVLAMSVQDNNQLAANQTIAKMERLGAAMKEAGVSTDSLALSFATAKYGFTDLNSALGEGGMNAQQLAQDYIDFKTSIGELPINAVQGAALIANGFSTAAQAAQAGDEAIQGVLNDLMRFSEAQGLLDGLDASGIESTLTGLAHAMNLIPENKVIQISAEGNLEVVEQAENKLANMDDSAAVTINAQDNATGKAEEVQGKLQGLNQIPVNPPINAQDNASSVIDNVKSKLSALDGTTATTTVITEYKTKGKPPGETARGAQSFSGGLTYLNDQKGINDAREVIEYAGRRFWYEGKNVLANIPRGARIYTAAQSKSFINGSHENGLARVPFDGYIAELHEGERVLTANEAAGYNGFNFNDMLSVLADMIAEMRSGGGSDRGGNGGGRIVYAPNITIQGNADEATLTRVMRMSQQEFEEMYDEMQHNRDRTRF